MSKKTTIITVSALAIAAALTFGVAACSSTDSVESPTKATRMPAISTEAAAPVETEAPAVPLTPREEVQTDSGLTPAQYADVAADFANYGTEGLKPFIAKVEGETGRLVTVVKHYPCPVDPSIMIWGTAGELQIRPAGLCNATSFIGLDLDAVLSRLQEVQDRKGLSDDEVTIIVID